MNCLFEALLIIFLCITLVTINTQSQNHYHSYDELIAKLEQISKDHSKRTFLYSIGKSGENRDLWVMAIANDQPHSHLLLRPEIKYVGNVDGNELATREILLQFITHLLTNPENDTRVDEILENMRTHILVSMYPDDAEMTLRNSFSNKLMRRKRRFDSNQNNYQERFLFINTQQQPESHAVEEWSNSERFLLSGELHTTQHYANKRECEFVKVPKYVEATTVNDDVMSYLSTQFGSSHKTVSSSSCDGDSSFRGAPISGVNRCPPARGGMVDTNYWKYGTKEISMDMGSCSTPPAADLPQIWSQNKNKLIEFPRAALLSIRGFIRYHNGQPARFVSVQFNSKEPIKKTTDAGEYADMLLPGIYKMKLMFNCDVIHELTVTIQHFFKYDIVLDDSLYEKASQYSLDSSAICCDKLQVPYDCATGETIAESASASKSRSHSTSAAAHKFIFNIIFSFILLLLLVSIY